MPADDGLRLDDDEGAGPVAPDTRQPYPERANPWRETRTRPFATEDGELLAQGEVLEREVTPRFQRRESRRKQSCEEPEHHGPRLPCVPGFCNNSISYGFWPGTGHRIFSTPLVRLRRERGAVVFAVGAPPAPEPAEPRASRAAQMLALAHEFQGIIDTGEVADRAELAGQVGLTRARLTQLFDLLLLAPDIQEDVLMGVAYHSARPISERQLRWITRYSAWRDQRTAWKPCDPTDASWPRTNLPMVATGRSSAVVPCSGAR
jgi:hypothetical protein